MKKTATTVIEVLIAIAVIAVISMIAMTTLRVNVNRDTDIIKFKHAFATLSEVINFLRNDALMYPDANVFANMDPAFNSNENRSYGGPTKFKKLFTSKFNVLESDIVVNFGNMQVPLIRYKRRNRDDYEYFNSSNRIKCFMENKGFMFCPPETDVPSNTYALSYIYIPVYINQIDINDPDTMSIEKAIFIEVSYDGKVEIPGVVYYNKPYGAEYKENETIRAYYINNEISKVNVLIDCIDKKYNSYNHCKVLDKMLDMDH